MKTRKITTIYSNLEFETFLMNENNRIVKLVVIPRAQELGEINKPEPNTQNGIPYIGEFRSEFQSLVLKSKETHQPEIEYQRKIEQDKNHEVEQEGLHAELNEIDEKIRIKNSEYNRCNKTIIVKKRNWNLIKWPIYLIGLADIVIASSSFEIMAISFLGSFIIGVGLALALLFFSEKAPNLIRRGKTRLQKIGIITLMSSLVIAVFYSLALFRIIRLSDNLGLFGAGLNPITFVLINYFIFVVITILSYFLKPTEEEQKTLHEIEVLVKERKELENQRADIINSINISREKKLESTISSAQVLLYARNCELRILALYRASYDKFIATNLHHRRDHLVPIFFNDGPPPIQTFYQNEHTNNP